MRLLLLAAALLTPALSLHAQEDFSLDWWTVDGGGGTSTDDVFTVSGTIGQPDAGVMSDGYFTVAGGFWPSPSIALPGQTIRTWNGLANGDWFNATNWSPAGVPGPYDTIVFSGGTIALTSTVTIHGQFNWSGGSLSGGALTVASDGVLNIGGAAVSLAGALTNAGTVNWTGGTVAVCCAGPIVNLAGALWDIQCDQTLSPACCVPSNFQFQNAGTVRKSAGSGTTYLQVPFYNAGTVIALQGTLDFQSGGTVDGGYNALAGAAIKFVSGDFVAGAVPVLNGPGPIQFTGGTLTLPSGVVPNLPLAGGTLVLGPNFQGGTITNLTLVGAALSGTNTVSGTLDWLAGTVSGPLTVAKGAVLNLSGGGVSLASALTNAGTVNWTSGTVAICCAGPIVNLAGALWDIQCDQTLSPACCVSSNFQFLNAGTVRKSAGVGATYLQIPFYNAGTVAALQGTLNFQSGGTVDGTYNALAGAAIKFTSGDFVAGEAPALSGPGPIQFTGDRLTLPSDLVASLQLVGGRLVLGPNFQGGTISNLTLNGVTLSGTNTVSGTLDWLAGTVSGLLTVVHGGVLNIGGGYVSLRGALTNAGTVNWTSGTVGVCCAGPLVNQAGALWDIQCDQTLYETCCVSSNFQFLNAGTVRKSAGSGTTYLQIPFYNAGRVIALQGTLGFQSGGTVDGSYNALAGAAINFISGDFVNGTAPALSGPGPIEVTGGTLTLVSDVIANLQMVGGTLALGPGFQGGTITNLTLAGMKLSGTNKVSGTFNCGGGALGGLWVAEGAVMNWSGGTVAGPLMVATGGVLNLAASSGGVVSVGNTLANAGTVNWTSGTLAVCCAGPLVNQAGALWDIQCDQTLYETCCVSSNFQFLNAGTVRKSAGSGTTYLQIPFYNSGSLSLLSGSVNFNSANTYTQTGATLNFGLAGTGQATPLVVGGNLSLDGTLSASLLDSYTPKPGDTIPLISCGALTNSFNSLDLPVAGNNLGWRMVYAANEVSLQVVSNGNTTVQIAGTVTDTSGAPVANLTVFAFTTNSSNSLFLSAATDGSGHYGLSVVNGLWRVGLEGLAARGYNDVPTQDVMVNDAGQTLNFVLLVQPVTRPALRCTLAGSQLLFSWPASLSGVELRITGNLADPNSWRAVPVVPVQAGAEMQVTAPLVPGNHFYRLFRP